VGTEGFCTYDGFGRHESSNGQRERTLQFTFKLKDPGEQAESCTLRVHVNSDSLNDGAGDYLANGVSGGVLQ
jgi:hypothetical protein